MKNIKRLKKELKEGFVLSGAGSGDNLMIPINAPHPNAARLFTNWVLSIEGQTARHRISEGTPDPSLREDIPCDGNVDPDECRVEGVVMPYLTADPEYTVLRSGANDRAIEIFNEVRGK